MFSSPSMLSDCSLLKWGWVACPETRVSRPCGRLLLSVSLISILLQPRQCAGQCGLVTAQMVTVWASSCPQNACPPLSAWGCENLYCVDRLRRVKTQNPDLTCWMKALVFPKGHSEGRHEGGQVEGFLYFLVLLCSASGTLNGKALHHLKKVYLQFL